MSARAEDPTTGDLLPAHSGRAWNLAEGTEALARSDVLPPGFTPGDFLVGGLDCGARATSYVARELQRAGVAAIIARTFSQPRRTPLARRRASIYWSC